MNAATQKARVAAHSIANAFISREAKTWANLYRTFARPHIEYAMPAWIPHQSNHLKQLESVQRWFTRQIPGIRHLDHRERYAACGLQSVQDRCERGVAIETFKIVSGMSSAKVRLQPHGHIYETRGRTDGNLDHVKPNRDLRKYSFAARAPIIWDSIIPAAKISTTVNGFKNAYDAAHGL